MKIYLVGGAVRDKLLGLPVRERDWLVVGATPQQLLAKGYQQVGRDFPVFLHPETYEEYALARTERKSGSGYTGFTCYAAPDVTLEQDLLRRDLTINAIAQDDVDNLYDPYGGQRDLNDRILRHVSPAFKEDPLRILRLARFAATFAHLGFTIAPETQEMVTEMVTNGELTTLVPERVWKETERALTTQSPQIFFRTLREFGALAVLYPELDALFGVPAPEKWHPEIDTGIHTLMALEQAAKLTDDLLVRFAALCHDLGKGNTPKEIWPHHYGHAARGVPLILAMCNRVKAPAEVRDFAALVAKYHDLIHDVDQLKAKTVLSLFDNIDVWRKPERLPKLLLVSEADFKGRTGWQDKPYPPTEYVMKCYQVAVAVTAQQVIQTGITGPAIKQALHECRIAAIKTVTGK